MTTKKKEESITIKGENLLKKVKELIQEGNVRRITIIDKTGKELIVFSLTVGVCWSCYCTSSCCGRSGCCFGN